MLKHLVVADAESAEQHHEGHNGKNGGSVVLGLYSFGSRGNVADPIHPNELCPRASGLGDAFLACVAQLEAEVRNAS
jgi:hypothetical protein